MIKKTINNFKENKSKKQNLLKNRQLIFNNKNKILTINNMKEKTIKSKEYNNKKQNIIKNIKPFLPFKKRNNFNNKIVNQGYLRNRNKFLRRYSRLTVKQKKIFREKC